MIIFYHLQKGFFSFYEDVYYSKEVKGQKWWPLMITLWWLTNRKHKKTFWLDASLLRWWKKVMYPQNDVHISEDILTKMITKCPLTLNFFWVVWDDDVYVFCVSVSKTLFVSMYTIKYAYWNIYLSFVIFSLYVYTIKILNFKCRGCISTRAYPIINIKFVTYT